MITCYVPEKRKAKRVLEAFAAGCGATLANARESTLRPGAAVFYGINEQWIGLLQQAQREGREWYYLDNAWFDVARGDYFRIGHNAMQTVLQRPSDGSRLRALGIEVKPWRKTGRNIIICSQSERFMRLSGWKGGEVHWRGKIQERVRRQIGRSMIQRDKATPRELRKDLANAFQLVTHSSASAVQALLEGVPVTVTDPRCVAAPFSGEIGSPVYPDGREEWAARLADSQWTLDEFRSGYAWRMLHGLG